jgi:hypothetical protein
MFEKPPPAVPVGVATIIPDVAGKVSVVDPATAGADKVILPLVSPAMTNDDIFYFP